MVSSLMVKGTHTPTESGARERFVTEILPLRSEKARRRSDAKVTGRDEFNTFLKETHTLRVRRDVLNNLGFKYVVRPQI